MFIKKILLRVLQLLVFVLISTNVIYATEIQNPSQIIKDLGKFKKDLQDVSFISIGNEIIAQGKITTSKEKQVLEVLLNTYSILNLVEDGTRPKLITIQAQLYEISHVSGSQYDGMDNHNLTTGASLLYNSGDGSIKQESESGDLFLEIGPGQLMGALTLDFNADIFSKIKYLKDVGRAKLLSTPIITVEDGKEASILSGGEIPITLGSELGGYSTEWKTYGNSVKFTPRIASKGRSETFVSLIIEIEVSTLDRSFSATIPAITKRSVYSEVTIVDRKPFVISGIIYENESESISKVPILGDILPFLFRKTSKFTETKELVIVVQTTTHLGDFSEKDYIYKTLPKIPDGENK